MEQLPIYVSEHVASTVLQNQVLGKITKQFKAKSITAQLCVENSQKIEQTLLNIQLSEPSPPSLTIHQSKQTSPHPIAFKVKRQRRHKSNPLVHRNISRKSVNIESKKICKKTSLNDTLDQLINVVIHENVGEHKKQGMEVDDGVRQLSVYSQNTTSYNNLGSQVFQFLMKNQEERMNRSILQRKRQNKISEVQAKLAEITKTQQKAAAEAKKIKQQQQAGKKFIFSMNTDYDGTPIASAKKNWIRPNPTYIEVDYQIHDDEKQKDSRKSNSTLKEEEELFRNKRIQKLEFINERSRFMRVMSMQEKNRNKERSDSKINIDEKHRSTLPVKQYCKNMPKNISFSTLQKLKQQHNLTQIQQQQDHPPPVTKQATSTPSAPSTACCKLIKKKKKDISFQAHHTRPYILHQLCSNSNKCINIDIIEPTGECSTDVFASSHPKKLNGKNYYQKDKKQNVLLGNVNVLKYLLMDEQVGKKKKVTFDFNINV